MSMNNLLSKRHLVIAASAFMLAIASPLSAAAAPAPTTSVQQKAIITVELDRQPVSLTNSPVLLNGSVMLPAKELLDAVHASLRVDKDKITASLGSVTIKGTLGSKIVWLGKQKIVLSAAPTTISGRLYVPAKFISLVLNKSVTYDSKKKHVSIGYTQDQMDSFQKQLYDAAISGNAAAVETLIKRGVDVNLKLMNSYGNNTPLDYALLHNRTAAAVMLLTYGGQYDPVRVPHVIDAGNVELLRALLSNGLDPNFTSNGISLLSWASGIVSNGNTNEVRQPNREIVELFLKYGAEPTSDALYNAVFAQNYEIIQLLLQYGADPYLATSFSTTTPFEMASSNGIAKWLTLGASQTLASISFVEADGVEIKEGNLWLGDSAGYLTRMFHWTNTSVYLDLADGEHILSAVSRFGKAYVLPAGTKISVDRGAATPATYQLPSLNVIGTVTGEEPYKKNGLNEIFVYDTHNNMLIDVEVYKGKFGLYLPPGTYQLEYVMLADEVKPVGGAELVVQANGSTQQFTLQLPAAN